MLLSSFLIIISFTLINGAFNEPAPQLLPPPSVDFHTLAKSDSSAQLASEFLAREQQQHASQSSALPQQASTINRPRQNSKALPSMNFRLDLYHPLSEINAYLEALAKRYEHVSLFPIGQTHEKRPVRAVEIINNKTDSDFIWVDALTHAREWVTGSTVLYLIDQLVAARIPGHGIGSRNAASRLMHSKNFIIIPVVNPDGYSYTWETDRMWRKNRSPTPGSSCFGADLNRNFDHSFGGQGSSNNPCSHIFSGSYAFSEPETKSMADLMWSLKDRIKFYLTIHSYNQLWACPYASTTSSSLSLNKHMKVLTAIQKAVKEAEGVTYEIGPLSTSLYVGSGFGLDFAYDICGIEHSYLVELRDKGTFGFQLPSDLIMPTARETYAGLQAGLWTVFVGGAGGSSAQLSSINIQRDRNDETEARIALASDPFSLNQNQASPLVQGPAPKQVRRESFKLNAAN